MNRRTLTCTRHARAATMTVLAGALACLVSTAVPVLSQPDYEPPLRNSVRPLTRVQMGVHTYTGTSLNLSTYSAASLFIKCPCEQDTAINLLAFIRPPLSILLGVVPQQGHPPSGL